MAKRKIVEKEPKKKKVFLPYGDINETLDNIEKLVELTESSLDKNEGRMPTGLLMLDIILGGGITTGLYTNFGKEQSCKTTLAVTILFSALLHKVPFIYYWDYEGSGEPTYLECIMHRLGISGNLKEVFGERDNKGQWIHLPKIRYRDESIAEKFFDFVSQLERKLPDKRRIGGDWYYIYENTRVNKERVGDKYDESYFKKHGKFKVPAENGSLQAFILLDSYPAMLPERMDVDDPSNAMAVQARMFSEQLKRIKGRLKGKRITIYGINQLRLNPGARFGNPEYEPGGEALKLYSDVRMRLASRAISAVPGATGKGVEKEPSVNMEGEDTYRYVHGRAIKNKLSVPDLESFFRMWVSDANGVAQGFDPVFDTYCYLKVTGQLSGKRNSIKLQLANGNKSRRTLDWADFKTLILGDKKQMLGVFKSCKMEKPVLLRKFCQKQLASGKGLDLYFETKRIAPKEVKEDAQAEEI